MKKNLGDKLNLHFSQCRNKSGLLCTPLLLFLESEEVTQLLTKQSTDLVQNLMDLEIWTLFFKQKEFRMQSFEEISQFIDFLRIQE